MRSLHQHDKHGPGETEKNIPCYVDFPAGEFSPLIKKCFEHTLSSYDLEDLIFSKVFPLYHQFLQMIYRGYIVTAKTSIRKEALLCLNQDYH